MFTECVDEARLFLADEVQVQLVPALVDVLLQPRGVPAEVTGDVHRFLDLFGRDVLADDVEGLDRLDVPARRRREDVAAPLVMGDGEGFVVAGCPAEVDLQPGRPTPACFAVRVQDLLQRLLGLVDGDQCVRPRGMAGSGLRRDGRPDEIGNGFGQGPQPGAVDVNEALVAHLLTRQQAPDDVNAFDEALVANLLARPHFSGYPLVRCFTGSERRPESTRKHLRKSRDRLGDDRRVVALPGCIDHAERNAGRGQRGAEK